VVRKATPGFHAEQGLRSMKGQGERCSGGSFREVQVQIWSDEVITDAVDALAEETPVALQYHGISYVVMLATPADLEDFAVGFTLTEALVRAPDEIRSVQVRPGRNSMEVAIDIAAPRFSELLERRRNLTGRTGCGLCGVETVEEAIRPAAVVGAGPSVTRAQLRAALLQLQGQQILNARTGSVHAAAWVIPGKGIQLVREDVGRHNALDKAIGALIRTQADIEGGFMVITSRASSEMVQKAATAGITFLVAISAPTALAVRLAQEGGLTLVGFAREHRHVVYAHGQRLTDE
jgi:formate dehydrogenase accessory protein FdhD